MAQHVNQRAIRKARIALARIVPLLELAEDEGSVPDPVINDLDNIVRDLRLINYPVKFAANVKKATEYE